MNKLDFTLILICMFTMFLIFLGPVLNFNNRIEILEKYHCNTCSECGQVLYI